MPGRKDKTSRLLLLLSILLCISLGYLLTHSSGSPSPLGGKNKSDIILAQKDPSKTETNTSASPSSEKDSGDTQPTPSPTATLTPSPTPVQEVSAEAEKGIWVSSGGIWQFLVDGTPYVGWLYDTDGHHYYFNSDGIMQTGWLEDNGKRYYLDEDGIMQTGVITIDGKEYEFLDDGSQKVYIKELTETPTPAPQEEKEKAETKQDNTKQVAFTFDDGPGEFTEELLDILAEYNVKATFFLIGQEIPNYPDAVKRMNEMGCEIGNHSYDHKDFTTLKPEEIASKIQSVNDLITSLTGQEATLLRPPYGNINDDVRAVSKLPMVLWSVDTLDWKTQNTDSIVEETMNNIQDGSVVLMHDIYKTTLEAVKILIPRLLDEGYELLTVHELAAARQIEMQPGIAYGSFDRQDP